MRVRWVRAALRNLDQAAMYIAEDDPQAAARMVGQVRDSVHRLARHPALGRPGRVPGTRELVVPGTPFVIPYRVSGNAIEILRVFHGARRWPEDMRQFRTAATAGAAP